MAKTSSIPRYYNRSKPITRNIPSSPSKSNGSATLLTNQKGKDTDSEEDPDEGDEDEDEGEDNDAFSTSHKENHHAPESSLWMFQGKSFGTAQKGSLCDNSTNLLGGVTAPWDMEGMYDQYENPLGADTSQLFPIPKATARNSAKRPVSSQGSVLLSPNRSLMKGQRLKNPEPDAQMTVAASSSLRTRQPAPTKPGSSKDTLPLGAAELNTLENHKLRRDVGRAEVETTASRTPGVNLASRLSSVPPDLPPSAIKKHTAVDGAAPKSTKKARFAPSEEDRRAHVFASTQPIQMGKPGQESRTTSLEAKAGLENETPLEPANDVFGPKDVVPLHPSNSLVPTSLVEPISPDRPSYPISQIQSHLQDASAALNSRQSSETNVPAFQNSQLKRSKTHTPLASFNRVSRSPSSKQKSIQAGASQSSDPSLTRASSMSKTELLKPTRVMRNVTSIAASSQHKIVRSSSEDSSCAPSKPHTRQKLPEPSQTTSRLTKQVAVTPQVVTDASSTSQIPDADLETPQSINLGVTSTSSNPTGSSGGASDATEIEELHSNQHAIPVRPSSNLTNRIHVSELNARRLSTLIELPTPNSTFGNQKSASTIRNSLDTTDLSILSKAEGFPNTSTPYQTGPISLPLPPDTIRLSATRPKRSARRSSIGLSSPIKGPSIVPLDMSNVSVQVKSVKNVDTQGKSKSNHEVTSQSSSVTEPSNQLDTPPVPVFKSPEPSTRQHRPPQPPSGNMKSTQVEPNAQKRAGRGAIDRCQGTSSQQAPDSSNQPIAARPSKSLPRRLASGVKNSRKQEQDLPSTNLIPTSQSADARRVSNSAPLSHLQSQRLPKSRGQDDPSRSCSTSSNQPMGRTEGSKKDGTKDLNHEKARKRDSPTQAPDSQISDNRGNTGKTSREIGQTKQIGISSKAESTQPLPSTSGTDQEEPIVEDGTSLPSKGVTEDNRVESGSLLPVPRLRQDEGKQQPAQRQRELNAEGGSTNKLSRQSSAILRPSDTKARSSVSHSNVSTAATAPIPSTTLGTQSYTQPPTKRTLPVEGERPQVSNHASSMSIHPSKRPRVPSSQLDPGSKTRRPSKSRQSALPSELNIGKTEAGDSKAKSHDLACAADIQKPSSGATSAKHTTASNLPIVSSKSGEPGKVVHPQTAPTGSGQSDFNRVPILNGTSKDERGSVQDSTKAMGNPPSTSSQSSSKQIKANRTIPPSDGSTEPSAQVEVQTLDSSEPQEALHSAVATVRGETHENTASQRKTDIKSASPKHTKRKRIETKEMSAQLIASSHSSRLSESPPPLAPAEVSTRKKSRDSHTHQSDVRKDPRVVPRAAVSPGQHSDEVVQEQAVPVVDVIDLLSPRAKSTSATMFTIALEAPTDSSPSHPPEPLETQSTSVSKPTASTKPVPPPLLTLPKAFTFSVRSGAGSGERIKDKREKAMQAGTSNATSSQKHPTTHKAPSVAVSSNRPKINARPREEPSDIANERATKRTRTAPITAVPARPKPTTSTRPRANLSQKGVGTHSRVRAAIGRLNKLAQVSQPGPPIKRPQTRPAPPARAPVGGPSNSTLNSFKTSSKQNIVEPEPSSAPSPPHADHLATLRSNLMNEIREKNLSKTQAFTHDRVPPAASDLIFQRNTREKGKEKAVHSDVLQSHSHRVTDEVKSSDAGNRNHLGSNSRRGLEVRERVPTSRNVPNGSRATSQQQPSGKDHNPSGTSTGFQKCLNQWREVEARKLQSGEPKGKKQVPWNDVSLVHHELPVKDFKERPNMPDFKLATQRRAKEREDWEQTKAVKERYERQIKDQEEMKRLEKEREEYIRMRRDRIVKANPVPDYLKRSN